MLLQLVVSVVLGRTLLRTVLLMVRGEGMDLERLLWRLVLGLEDRVQILLLLWVLLLLEAWIARERLQGVLDQLRRLVCVPFSRQWTEALGKDGLRCSIPLMRTQGHFLVTVKSPPLEFLEAQHVVVHAGAEGTHVGFPREKCAALHNLHGR